MWFKRQYLCIVRDLDTAIILRTAAEWNKTVSRRIRLGEFGMDISFKVEGRKFNYRVCAIMISDSRILAMHDERSPYYYLPGGRVEMGETAEHAVVREIEEELNITPKIIRPLWFNQAFFKEDVDGLNYHELCIYYLMDITHTDLLSRGEGFSLPEGCHQHDFEWLEFERLKDEYFYPLFLKKAIFHLPSVFTMLTEYQ